MTRKDAIDQLIEDFHNDCIAKGWNLDETDEAICKALKIKILEG